MSMKKVYYCVISIIFLFSISCGREPRINELSDLNGKVIGIPKDIVSTNRILSIFPEAEIKHFDSVNLAIIELKERNIDAVLGEFHVLRIFQEQNKNFRILDDVVATKSYGFAVARNNIFLKERIDRVIEFLQISGLFDDMLNRWINDPEHQQKIPEVVLNPINGVLRFGTSVVVDDFSYVQEDGSLVGFDIEIAYHVAQSLDMGIEVVNTQFGALIPMLQGNRVDMIGGFLTITEDRQRRVIFSEPYLEARIGVMVRR
ncbi:MAG: transporter substrate-binding domain-containing protein [Candidatus Cloacimonetes bacterium]|nr:transporter substrate-binding domain-containing protein [Candidatus Cloacimonadota bacterium]